MAYKKPKKEKITLYYPKDFPGSRIIKKFKKPRSPRTKILACSDKDNWFVDVLDLKTRTGEVADDEGWITMKDVPQWVTWYKNLGWDEVKD
jgi:hypothetical protein